MEPSSKNTGIEENIEKNAKEMQNKPIESENNTQSEPVESKTTLDSLDSPDEQLSGEKKEKENVVNSKHLSDDLQKNPNLSTENELIKDNNKIKSNTLIEDDENNQNFPSISSSSSSPLTEYEEDAFDSITHVSLESISKKNLPASSPITPYHQTSNNSNENGLSPNNSRFNFTDSNQKDLHSSINDKYKNDKDFNNDNDIDIDLDIDQDIDFDNNSEAETERLDVNDINFNSDSNTSKSPNSDKDIIYKGKQLIIPINENDKSVDLSESLDIKKPENSLNSPTSASSSASGSISISTSNSSSASNSITNSASNLTSNNNPDHESSTELKDQDPANKESNLDENSNESNPIDLNIDTENNESKNSIITKSKGRSPTKKSRKRKRGRKPAVRKNNLNNSDDDLNDSFKSSNSSNSDKTSTKVTDDVTEDNVNGDELNEDDELISEKIEDGTEKKEDDNDVEEEEEDDEDDDNDDETRHSVVKRMKSNSNLSLSIKAKSRNKTKSKLKSNTEAEPEVETKIEVESENTSENHDTLRILRSPSKKCQNKKLEELENVDIIKKEDESSVVDSEKSEEQKKDREKNKGKGKEKQEDDDENNNINDNDNEGEVVEVVEDEEEDEDDDQTKISADAEIEAKNQMRKEAINTLTNIEIEFAKLRDRLHADQMCRFGIEMNLAQDGTHPELCAVLDQVGMRHRKHTNLIEQTMLYRTICIDIQTNARRDAIHQQFAKNKADLREKMMNETMEKWYGINKERRRMDADLIAPDYIFRVPSSRNAQVVQRIAYNNEVSLLSGIAKFVGFPAAPTLTSLNENSQIEDVCTLREKGSMSFR